MVTLPYAPTYASATARLRRRLGAQVDVSAKGTQAASFDGSKLSFLPAAVIRPKNEAAIAATLRLANELKVPVTVRGGGTSLTGSASPVKGGWVLDLSRWKKIRIDAEAGIAYVQAGARAQAVKSAAEALGWFYPPDPASKAYSTIGGNIACNAGGMHGGKYGVTRDYVLALKGFLPTGEPVAWGGDFKKYSAGFNLRDLWIGSEGMLGVVTEATLKLIPNPEARWTLLAAFADEEKALRAARELISRRIQPAIFEFLDRFSVQCAERATGATVLAGQSGRPVLLLELAGTRAEVKALQAAVRAWARESAVAWKEARKREESEALWSVRRKCSGAMFELGDSKLNEDIVVPLRSYERFARFLEKLRRKSGLFIPTFGHVADGNLHVNIMYHRQNRREAARAESAVQELMENVVAMGGAISGEHGIGLAKTPFLRLEHSAAEIKAMLAVKRALDPNGILNPGKMFEVFKIWEHERLAVKLPWDHK